MSLHREITFETEICAHLAAHGWLHVEGDASRCDRARALFPADILEWVKQTQPDAWQTPEKNHGPAASETFQNASSPQMLVAEKRIQMHGNVFFDP